MCDHSKGIRNDVGQLNADEPVLQRVTGGVTLSLGTKRPQADIRLNYELYFYQKDVPHAVSERSKIVLEFVAHF